MAKHFALAWLLTILTSVAVQAATTNQVSAFMAVATSHAQTDEALAALKVGPDTEYYRWGEETCTWVRMGKSSLADTEANLGEFFGPDLASALVFAAVTVICPDIYPPCQYSPTKMTGFLPFIPL